MVAFGAVLVVVVAVKHEGYFHALPGLNLSERLLVFEALKI
jgi:hypothetical protein